MGRLCAAPCLYFYLRKVEVRGHSGAVANQDATTPEDLAQLLARLKDEYGVSESEIARRIDVSAATVNNWVRRKRGTGRGPNPEKLRAIAREFPKFSEGEIFAAAGRKTPGSLTCGRRGTPPRTLPRAHRRAAGDQGTGAPGAQRAQPIRSLVADSVTPCA